MACFIVSGVEAVVVTAVKKNVEKKEAAQGQIDKVKIPLSRKLSWLNNMLWGGAGLLMFEHVWHGEVTPFFPFLTAMADKADTMEMLHEMATIGVSMAALVTCVWLGICAVADAIVKRSGNETTKDILQEG